MSIRIIFFDSGDSRYDIAFEEALARLRARDIIPDTLRLWSTSRSIVLGYFRTIDEDVNIDLAEREGVPIIRRFTGGGTVYLDQGCLNYSIVIKRSIEFPITYLYGTLLNSILIALKSLGFSPYLANTNDVVVNGRKVSGTAASIRWNVLFLHGSILVDADLRTLYRLLKIPKEIKPSIDPVKYRVANLREFKSDLEIEDLVEAIIKGFSTVLSANTYVAEPSKIELEAARILYKLKYSHDELNMRLPYFYPADLEKRVEDELIRLD